MAAWGHPLDGEFGHADGGVLGNAVFALGVLELEAATAVVVRLVGTGHAGYLTVGWLALKSGRFLRLLSNHELGEIVRRER